MRSPRSLPRWSRSADDRKPSAGCGSFPGLPWFVFLLEYRTQFALGSGYGRNVHSRFRAYHSMPRKMADARPTFPLAAQRYTQAQTKAVQPPDDRTYSAEVTSFPSNLPHHRSARAEFPYTRSIMIPPFSPFVKHFFRIIYKKPKVFSLKSENKIISSRQTAALFLIVRRQH